MCRPALSDELHVRSTRYAQREQASKQYGSIKTKGWEEGLLLDQSLTSAQVSEDLKPTVLCGPTEASLSYGVPCDFVRIDLLARRTNRSSFDDPTGHLAHIHQSFERVLIIR